jgi:hypothetical protein
LVKSLHQNSRSDIPSISGSQDTTPLGCIKAKPCGCSASLRSLDTASLARSQMLALMEKGKNMAVFLTIVLDELHST